MLTWSGLIPTLNRGNILRNSLPTFINQTRLPKQIIIIDASDNWQESKAEVENIIAQSQPEVECVYLQSEIKSIAYQANLGAEKCSSDILIILDDDSFPYPNYAEELLKVYESDREGIIGGTCGRLMATPPDKIDPEFSKTLTSASEKPRSSFVQAVQKLWYQEQLFLPYDGEYHAYDTSEIAQEVPIKNVALFHGCRMSYRTLAFREVGGFDLMLFNMGTDIDLSYRISQKYALVLACDALIYHDETPVARIKYYSRTCLILANTLVLYILNSPKDRDVALKTYTFAITRCLLELARDAAKPQRGFPNARGAFHALRSLPKFLKLDRDRLREWYPEYQRSVLQSK
ncbi:MAG: glycosyltransferase [Jaaginema sp. PMC 1079.18]|nr:glycosyltransferase [Jaaginema sp. PMC 1080.18]MEC4852244.1 glycosyltransferase [Jaaginema sp. PMC 1079.18]MEC4865086.1 glycosyltransferase [Jaaginema sp. PMC 1078.18]